jgi:hypothetical protein
LRCSAFPCPSGRPLPAPELLDLVVEVAGEAAKLEQGLGEHASDRGQLAWPGRLLGGHHLCQRPRGGQLLAPKLLLVVCRVPPLLRRHAHHPSLRLAPRRQRYGHSVATRWRFEYPICRPGTDRSNGLRLRAGPQIGEWTVRYEIVLPAAGD